MMVFNSIKVQETYLEARATGLVKRLNDDPESPWFMQIRTISNRTGLINQCIFADKLKTLLSEKRRGLLHIYTEEDQYSILKNYFSAIKLIGSSCTRVGKISV